LTSATILPRGPFRRIEYDVLLQDKTPSPGRPRTSPARSFSWIAVAPREWGTPLGPLTEPEVLAYATATLLKNPITRPDARLAAC
jgi:hypothetical protein